MIRLLSEVGTIRPQVPLDGNISTGTCGEFRILAGHAVSYVCDGMSLDRLACMHVAWASHTKYRLADAI